MRYTFILLLVLFTACSKYKHEIVEYDLSGDYEWYYSIDGPANAVAFDQVENQYGIRFKKSGRICFYENGKLLEKYRIVTVRETDLGYDGDVEIIYKIDKFKRGELILDGTELVHSDWPLEGMTNKFLKVSE